MSYLERTGVVLTVLACVLSAPAVMGQTAGEKEEFTAIAIVNNNLRSGAGTVLMDVTRWSTAEERQRLVNTLRDKGPEALLEALQKNRSAGSIRTPDSLAYDLRFAHQTTNGDGTRRVVLATDRPIGFWEAANRPRTIDYPFTVIQMELDREGHGKGTLSYATKITARGDVIELENFATSPAMLTEIRSKRAH